MEISLALTLTIGTISITLAIVAIWYSYQAERKSTDNYNRTKDVLSEISQKAAVIESTVTTTQQKLVDTITEIATPHRETQEEMLMKTLLPAVLQNPQIMENLMTISQQQQPNPNPTTNP